MPSFAYLLKVRTNPTVRFRIFGGAGHGQPRQARSREEKAKEKTNKDVEQAGKTGDRIQTGGADIANRKRDGRVSKQVER
jgi:hypothetical protein